MRKPHEMSLVGLDAYEYQKIGEIAVLSGMLEQALKEMIVRMVKAPWPDGLALVAHLNFSSLLRETLGELIEAWDLLFGLGHWLEIERGESTLPPGRSRTRRAAQKANPRKLQHPPQ